MSSHPAFLSSGPLTRAAKRMSLPLPGRRGLSDIIRQCRDLDQPGLTALFGAYSAGCLPGDCFVSCARSCAAVQLLQPVTDLTLGNRSIHLTTSKPLF